MPGQNRASYYCFVQCILQTHEFHIYYKRIISIYSVKPMKTHPLFPSILRSENNHQTLYDRLKSSHSSGQSRWRSAPATAKFPANHKEKHAGGTFGRRSIRQARRETNLQLGQSMLDVALHSCSARGRCEGSHSADRRPLPSRHSMLRVFTPMPHDAEHCNEQKKILVMFRVGESISFFSELLMVLTKFLPRFRG